MDRPRVLCVDADRDTADSTAAVLSLSGLDAAACYSGPAALAEAAASGPDVCVLDLDLAGADGAEVARRLRERAGERPPGLVAVTGWAGEGWVRRAVDAGFDAYLLKPADPVELAAAVAALCRRTRPAPRPVARGRAGGHRSGADGVVADPSAGPRGRLV